MTELRDGVVDGAGRVAAICSLNMSSGRDG